jgi:SAM-dependent methyltransferase
LRGGRTVIDPKAVIAQHSVEEFCKTAEEYYRRVSDPTPLMAKPFAFLHETPEMLQNMGLLLSGLHLGKTMTVLEFGAGTCWFSRFLTQLNCQVICCDASKTALDIGRRLFEELPLLGTAVFKPQFLGFDGHHIDLPDESVDRVICFDAFHHIPNQAEIISELGRVLKRGGIAGFSEPGRQHSRSPQSQYEMRNHKVLENDIDLDAIFELARLSGFTALSVKVLSDMEVPLETYDRIYSGEQKDDLVAELWNNTYNTTFGRSIFFLHKGAMAKDSRSHDGLAHTIAVSQNIIEIAHGTTLTLSFTITNTGNASWLHTNAEIFGIVRLGSHLYTRNGDLIELDYSRHDLPEAVHPGQSIVLTVDVPVAPPGAYRMAFDLVAEGVAWFENLGSKSVAVDVTVR